MWASCFTLIGKNGHIPTFGYNRCKVQQISTQKSFSKNFVAIGKNAILVPIYYGGIYCTR